MYFNKILFIISIVIFINIGSFASDFFENAPDWGLKLPKEKLYPEGQIMLYTGFCPYRDFDQIVKSGFTAIGPYYNGIDKMLKESKENGLKYIYTIRGLMRDGRKVTNKILSKEKILKEDWEYIEDSIRKQVKEVKDEKNILLWYLEPEELRFWRKNEILYLEKAVKVIKESDPQKRPVWMYDPGHRHTEHLMRTAKYLNIVGKGAYTNYSGMENQRVWIKWTLEQELEAINKTGKKRTIPILVPEMFKSPKCPQKISDYVRHDVFLGLVSGAKGVVIFSLFRRKNFPVFQEYLDAYCDVAHKLFKTEYKLNRFFLFGAQKNDLKISFVSGPQTLDMLFLKKFQKKYSSVNFVNIALKNHRLLIAVNSSNENVRVCFNGFPVEKIKSVNPFTGESVASPESGKLIVSLTPLEVKAYLFYRN